MKAIVLCADDYGQAPSISEGILALLADKRISAASCMVNTESWPEYASKVIAFQHDADIGLHFNLTHGEPLSTEFKAKYKEFSNLSTLIGKAYVGRLDKEVIAAELNAQLDAFSKAIGTLPRFLDGHQHVHQLPIIRDVMIETYNARLKQSKAYIRVVNMHLSPFDLLSKKTLIYLTGSRQLKQLLEQNKIPHNHSFSGIYNFANAKQYHEHFRKFLREIESGGLIMCHPGKESSGDDEIAEARFLEFNYFLSEQFQQDCADYKTIVRKF